MNKPLRHGRNIEGNLIYQIMRQSSKTNLNLKRKNFGKPVKKKSNIGKKSDYKKRREWKNKGHNPQR